MSFEYVMISSTFDDICKRIDSVLQEYPKYFIAVDFDETLWNNEQQNFNYFVKELLLKLKNTYSDKICFILWTCRTEEKLAEAINVIINSGIPISYFNENPEVNFGSRKIFANEYWDDRAISAVPVKIM